MSDETLRTIFPMAPVPQHLPRQREEVAEFLAFGLAGSLYALPLSSVREILKVGPITPVPRAHRCYLGILSVRGRVTTVMDLRTRLGVMAKEPDKLSRILLVDGGEEILGLLVDEVHQVYRLATEEIELTTTVGGDLSEHVMGIGRPAGQRGLAGRPRGRVASSVDAEAQKGARAKAPAARASMAKASMAKASAAKAPGARRAEGRPGARRSSRPPSEAEAEDPKAAADRLAREAGEILVLLNPGPLLRVEIASER